MKRFEHLLWVLAEECNEVGQRASKAARFGLAEIQPGQPLNNAERLVDEYADLLGAMELLVEGGFIALPSNEAMRKKIDAKKAKVDKFLAYSAQCGTLDADEQGGWMGKLKKIFGKADKPLQATTGE